MDHPTGTTPVGAPPRKRIGGRTIAIGAVLAVILVAVVIALVASSGGSGGLY